MQKTLSLKQSLALERKAFISRDLLSVIHSLDNLEDHFHELPIDERDRLLELMMKASNFLDFFIQDKLGR